MLSAALRRHFRRHCQRSPLQFSLGMGLESLAVALPLLLFLVGMGMESRTDLDELDAVGFFLVGVLAAPSLETLLFQLIPIACMRWLRVPFAWQIGISTFLFCVAHWPASAISGICAGLIGGFYLAFGYAHWATKSHWTAFWTTAVQHAIYNGMLFLFGLVAGTFHEAGSWMPDWLADAIVLGGAATYWACLIRDNARFDAQLGDRIIAAAEQMQPGTTVSEAKAILEGAGCECHEDAASVEDGSPARLWGVASSKKAVSEEWVWVVIADLESGIVTNVTWRRDVIADRFS